MHSETPKHSAKPQGQPHLRAGLTKRQTEVLERLEQGYPVKKIAKDIGVTRNAVYQHIDRLRRMGAVPETFTASGQPPRRTDVATTAGSASFSPGTLAPRESELRTMRKLTGPAGDEAAYASAVEAAIASGDVAALAYELGRADAEGRDDLPRKLVEAALRRLGVLDADRNLGSNPDG
jgi:DNA-binding CsgD family transcriptional regulator